MVQDKNECISYCSTFSFLFYNVLFFSLLSLKGNVRLMTSTSLSVCVFPLLNQLHFYEIRYGGHAIENDLDDILPNPAPSAIPKWRTFKLMRWMQNLQQSMWDHEILFADRSWKGEQVWKTKCTNMAASWNLKLIFYLIWTIHEPLHSDKLSLV
jgi:hypothetical protein